MVSLVVTLQITLLALAAGGRRSACSLAVLFAQSRMDRAPLFPYAVILQVTPIVAIAPLILIWVNDVTLRAADLRLDRRLLPDPVEHGRSACNTADHNLRRPVPALPRHAAGRRCATCALPSALPYFLAGLRIAGGLALIGAVVAEFVAGTGGAQSGPRLAHPRIGLPHRIPRMFAALVLVSLSASRSSWP